MKTSSAQYILVFRTNIGLKKDLPVIEKTLSTFQCVSKWNVDMHDIDKVLRIESSMNIPDLIISSLQDAGYRCAELED